MAIVEEKCIQPQAECRIKCAQYSLNIVIIQKCVIRMRYALQHIFVSARFQSPTILTVCWMSVTLTVHVFFPMVIQTDRMFSTLPMPRLLPSCRLNAFIQTYDLINQIESVAICGIRHTKALLLSTDEFKNVADTRKLSVE